MRKLLLVLFLAASTSGCVYLGIGHPGHGHGPPPHAKAHGRRAKGPDMHFDPALGVHVVVGYPDVYFIDGHYYRLVGGVWQIGVELDGPFHVVAYEKVPPGLAKKHGGKGKGKGKGKG